MRMLEKERELARLGTLNLLALLVQMFLALLVQTKMRVLEKERELARLGTLNLLAMPLLRLSLGSL